MILGATVQNTEAKKKLERSKDPLRKYKTMETIKDIVIDLHTTGGLCLVNCSILTFQDFNKLSKFFLSFISGIVDRCYHEIYHPCIFTQNYQWFNCILTFLVKILSNFITYPIKVFRIATIVSGWFQVNIDGVSLVSGNFGSGVGGFLCFLVVLGGLFF